jgi:hypothetical protein
MDDFTIHRSLSLKFIWGLYINFMCKNVLIASEGASSQASYIFFAGFLCASCIFILLIWSSVYASAIFLVLNGFINYFEVSNKQSIVARWLPSGWLISKGGLS